MTIQRRLRLAIATSLTPTTVTVRAVIVRPSTGVCTDSGAQLSPALVERFIAAGVPIEVVPLTVTIGDVDHLDGVDVCADRLAAVADATSLAVSPPSSGQMADAYDALVAKGCASIISIHSTGETSGAINAARLAARSLDVPVKVVDAGPCSISVSGGVWAVAEALISGASLDEATLVAEAVSPKVVCVAGSADVVLEQATAALDAGGRVRIAIGHSDAASSSIADSLAAAVCAAASRVSTTVLDVVRFRLGPSAGVYAAPGSVACVMLPAL